MHADRVNRSNSHGSDDFVLVDQGLDLVFQLDIYNPDGSPLLTKPQPGINAGKITVDQYRSLFSLNFNVVIGPNTRTEPGVSQWIPSTPTPAT